MRNLKRALSLTLASVMLLGMMVVGSSAAAGYDDVAETDNVEAIEVLQAIEVMVGDERGFGPERPVNRAEMAVVMGKLLSLDYDYYATSCPFNDVYDWARGWVGAAYANKILSGRGDGVYDPGSTVTAVEAALMLMRALGYFQYANDTADGWELATVRQGTKIGIFDGVGSSATVPMTRNQVAQMVLNALQCDTVEPDGNTINLTTPDGTVLTGKVNYVSVTRNEPWAHAISWVEASSVGSKNDGWIVELGERLYNGKLKLDDSFDPFGRPARKWEYDGKAIGTYAKKELMDKEYVGKVTGKDLYDQLGATTLKDYDVYCYVDGVYTDESAAVKTALGYQNDNQMGAYFNKLDMNKNNKAKVGNTGTGVKTEVYVDHDKDKVYVVVINTYLAIASRDYDAKKEEAPIRIYSIEKKPTVNEYVKVEQPTDKSVAFDLALEDFPSITSIKKDEAFLVTVAEEAVQTYKPAEVLSGVTVSAFSKNSNATVDGTKYDYTTTAAYKNSDLQAWTNTSVTNLKDRTYNIYLDAYGNLIGAEEVEAVKNYVFITGIDLNGSNRINQTADASAIFIDGTMDSIKVNMAKSTLRVYSGDDEDNNALLNTWCTYTKNGDIYTVKEVTEVDNGNGRPGVEYTSGGVKVVNDTKLAQYASYNAPTTKIDAKNYRLAGGAKKAGDAFYNVYGNKDSVYLTAKLGELHKSDAGKNNYGIIRDVLSVSTGIENTNIEVWDSIKAATEANKDNAQIKGEPDPAKTAYGVYTLYNDKGIIIAAVVVGEDAGTARDLVFVTSSDLDQEADNGGSAKAANDGLWTWTRKVVRDGQEVTLTEVGDEARSIDAKSMLQYQWYQVKSNANGEVISSTHVSSALTGTSSRYVTEYQKINETVETTGIDTVLYMTNGGPNNVGFGPKNILEINEDGRTLAVTNTYGSGIHFREDVNVVLVYWQKNAKETDIMEGSGIDDLRDLIDIVNEHSTSGARDAKAYYYVSALIKDGFATDIVIYDSFNDYNRPGAGQGSSSNGNVTYNDNRDEETDGVISDDKVTVQANGKVNAKFTLTKPDWAYMDSSNKGVTVYFDVFMDGEDEAYGSGFKTINSSDYKTITFSSNLLSAGDDKIFDNINESKGHTLTMEITGVDWPAANVEVYNADGTTKLALVEDSDTVKFLKTASDTLKFKLNTASDGEGSWTVTGAVMAANDAAIAKQTTANVSSAQSVATVKAVGGEPVKVYVTGDVAQRFAVTAFKDNTLAADGTQHSEKMDLKVGGTKVQSVYAKVGANYIQAGGQDLVADGKPIKFTINVDGLTDASLTNYMITYTLTNGEDVDEQTVAFKDGMTLEVNAAGDVDLTIDGITAEKSTVTMAKSVVVKTSDTDKRHLVITITYDKDLDRIRDFTTGDETDYVTSSNGGTLTVSSVAVSADKKTLVVTVSSSADFAANDTITVDNVALDENGEKVMSCTVELTEAAPATNATAVAADIRPGKR